MSFFALLDGEADNFGVVVPDLPGCTAAGKTADAAFRNAIKAVRVWVEDALEDGEKIPRARALMEILADQEVRRALTNGAALMSVPLLLDTGRPTRANVSMDTGMLAAIDEEAASRGLTRSAFLVGAALEKIQRGT